VYTWVPVVVIVGTEGVFLFGVKVDGLEDVEGDE